MVAQDKNWSLAGSKVIVTFRPPGRLKDLVVGLRHNAPELRRILRKTHLFLVSPHPDDIALSVGGLLLKVGAIEGITLCTVFSRSIWAPHLAGKSVDYVSRLRCQEEKSYAAAIGADLVLLDFPDSSLRGYSDQDQIGESLESDPTYWPVRQFFLKASKGLRKATFLCPLGIGDHVDHLVVRDVLIDMIKHDRIHKCIFYEDLPYANNWTNRSILRLIKSLQLDLQPLVIDISSDISMKLSRIGLYWSQIRDSDIADVLEHASRLGAPERFSERLWLFGSQDDPQSWPHFLDSSCLWHQEILNPKSVGEQKRLRRLERAVEQIA